MILQSLEALPFKKKTNNKDYLLSLASVASLTVDAFFRRAANSPVPVHKEAVAEWMAEPLHGRRHAATGGQTRLAGTAQKHSLSGERSCSALVS